MKNLMLLLLSLAILISSCDKSEIDENDPFFSFDIISSHAIGTVYSFKFSDDGTIYATTTSGLHKSLDNGGSWITLINDRFNPKDVMISREGSIFLNFNGYYLYKSDDYGDTWMIETLNLRNQMNYSAMDKSDLIYLSYRNSNYVYYAQHNFTEWDSIYFDYAIRSIERVDEDIYVICSNDDKQYHLFAKRSGKSDFEQLTTFIKFPNSFSTSLNGSEVFVITYDEIFNLNIEEGEAIKIKTPDRLEGYSAGFSDIIISDNKDILLYRNASFPAELYPSIVYKSENNGEHWIQLKEPEGEYTFDMKINPQHQLYISTYSNKIYRSKKLF